MTLLKDRTGHKEALRDAVKRREWGAFAVNLGVVNSRPLSIDSTLRRMLRISIIFIALWAKVRCQVAQDLKLKGQLAVGALQERRVE